MRSLIILLLVATVISSCGVQNNLNKTHAFASSETINVVVEIPAGTNKKIEYNKTTQEFAVDKIAGVERTKQYLPYPANYGFVPSTLSDPEVGGDGDPIDVFLIAESIPTGAVVEAIPIAMLRLVDEGEIDDKIICIPANKQLQIVKAGSIAELERDYPKLLEIIELWITYNETSEQTKVNGYVDAAEAVKEILVCEAAFINKN